MPIKGYMEIPRLKGETLAEAHARVIGNAEQALHDARKQAPEWTCSQKHPGCRAFVSATGEGGKIRPFLFTNGLGQALPECYLEMATFIEYVFERR